MPYSKPQVTIDLDEYNDLKDRIKRSDTGSGMDLAKSLGFILLQTIEAAENSRLSNYIRELLIDSKIRLSFEKGTNMAMAEPKDVIVKFYKNDNTR